MVQYNHSYTVDYRQTFGMDMIPFVDLIPYVSALAAIIAFGIKVGRLLQKLDHVIEDAKVLKEDVVDIKEKLQEHDRRITILETTTVRKA